MFKKLCGMFFSDLLIDLGIVNIFIYVCECGIVLNELFVVVICSYGSQKSVVVVGIEVKCMFGCILGNIVVICLMKDGVIVDFSVCEKMLQYFINKVYENSFLQFSLCVLICVLCKFIQVECWVICEFVLGVGVCEVFLIEELMVVVIGVGLLVEEVCGLMVVDIGGGIIEIVLIFFNGVVYVEFVCVGGDCFDEVIVIYVCCNYGSLIGEFIVECIKQEIGIVFLGGDVCEVDVCGCNLVEGVLCSFILNFNEVFEVLQEFLVIIVQVVKSVFE